MARKIGFLKHSTDATEQYETNITDKSKAQEVAEIFDQAAEQLGQTNKSALKKFNTIADMRISSSWDNQAFDINVTDAQQVDQLKKIRAISDPNDHDLQVKYKDVYTQLKIYIGANMPPKLQVVCQLNPIPVLTDQGQLYLTDDATAGLLYSDGVSVVTGLETDEEWQKPGQTTSDMIEQCRMKDNWGQCIDNFDQSDRAKLQQSNLIQVMKDLNQSAGEQNVEVQQCTMSQDWSTLLFLKLLVNPDSKLDLARVVLRNTIGVIEDVINLIFKSMRDINILGFKPFGFLPTITVYEHWIHRILVMQKYHMCPIFKVKEVFAISGKDKFIKEVKADPYTYDGKVRKQDSIDIALKMAGKKPLD